MAYDFLDNDEELHDRLENIPVVSDMLSAFNNDSDLRPYRVTAEDIIRFFGPFTVKDASQISEPGHETSGFDVISDQAYVNFEKLAEADQCLKFCEALAGLDCPNTIAGTLGDERT